MRAAIDARTVLRSVLLIPAFGLLTAGCNGPSGSGGSKPVNVSPSVTPGNISTGGSVRANAEAFLKPLLAGDVKAASARVSPTLKKQLTKPVFEEEQKVGYSEDDMQRQLKTWTAGHTAYAVHSEVIAPGGAEASLRGDLSGGEQKAAFALRLAKADGGWQVMRFAVTRPVAHSTLAEIKSPDLAWRREAALDFLDSFLGGPEDQELTMLVMTPEFKKKLPAPSVADTGLGYAKKDVRNWLNERRKPWGGYYLRGEKDSADRSEFSGTLMGPGESSRAYRVVVVSRDNAALVDDVAFE